MCLLPGVSCVLEWLPAAGILLCDLFGVCVAFLLLVLQCVLSLAALHLNLGASNFSSSPRTA